MEKHESEQYINGVDNIQIKGHSNKVKVQRDHLIPRNIKYRYELKNMSLWYAGISSFTLNNRSHTIKCEVRMNPLILSRKIHIFVDGYEIHSEWLIDLNLLGPVTIHRFQVDGADCVCSCIGGSLPVMTPTFVVQITGIEIMRFV